MTPFRPELTKADPPTAPASPSAATSTGLADAVLILRKRKYIILVAGLIGLLYGIYRFRTQEKDYVADGTIEIHSGEANAYRVGAMTSGGDSSIALTTQVAILRSNALLLAVAGDLDLANNQVFWRTSTTLPHLDLSDPAVRQGMLQNMNTDISIAIVPKTDLIRITCISLDPKLSADIVNTLVQDYITRSRETRYEASDNAANFLSKKLGRLRHEVEDDQAKVIDLGKKVGVMAFDPLHNQISTNLETLTGAVGTAEVQRINAESRYKILNSMDRSALDNTVDVIGRIGTSSGTSPLANLRAQRETLKVQIAQYGSKYGAKNPQMEMYLAEDKALADQINEEETRLLTQAHQDYIAAQTAEGQMRGALEAERTNAYKLRDQLIEYTLQQREYEANRTLYDSLDAKLRTAGVQAGLESTEIDVVDKATPATSPTTDSLTNIALVDTAVMIILGVILAFVLENLDTGVQSVAELEELTGLPSLALIPRARRVPDSAMLSVAQRNIATLSTPKSQFAEAFRALRTSLLLSNPGGEPQIVLCTSGTPSEGKTTAAINLSCVLAQRGVRVLLIDADLRRPTVHHRFGINGKVGLTSVLSGATPLADAVQSFEEIPTLDVLVSGPIPPFPTEMLGSDAMQRLLTQTRGIYTHIVLDSPPLLSVTDSVVLARAADAVIMVVRHGKSSKHTVRRSREILLRAGARITGIAFNAVDVNSPEYYAYYGYTGYSGYTSASVDGAGWAANEKPKDQAAAKSKSKNGGEGSSR